MSSYHASAHNTIDYVVLCGSNFPYFLTVIFALGFLYLQIIQGHSQKKKTYVSRRLHASMYTKEN
jgi:hypothetical protein